MVLFYVSCFLSYNFRETYFVNDFKYIYEQSDIFISHSLL
jgi:hypothetical protein